MSVSRGFAKLYFHYQLELYRELKLTSTINTDNRFGKSAFIIHSAKIYNELKIYSYKDTSQAIFKSKLRARVHEKYKNENLKNKSKSSKWIIFGWLCHYLSGEQVTTTTVTSVMCHAGLMTRVKCHVTQLNWSADCVGESRFLMIIHDR